MFDRFTDSAKRCFNEARKIAQSYGHEYLGSEHIALALYGMADCRAQMMLRDVGVQPSELAQALRLQLSRGDVLTPTQLPFSPGAKRVLELSMENAASLRHTWLGSEHLLLGLVAAKPEVPCSRELVQRGASHDKLFDVARAYRFPEDAPEDGSDALTRQAVQLEMRAAALKAAQDVLVHMQQFDLASKLRDLAHQLKLQAQREREGGTAPPAKE